MFPKVEHAAGYGNAMFVMSWYWSRGGGGGGGGGGSHLCYFLNSTWDANDEYGICIIS